MEPTANTLQPPKGTILTPDDARAMMLSFKEEMLGQFKSLLTPPAGGTSGPGGAIADAARGDQSSRGRDMEKRFIGLDPFKGKGLGMARVAKSIALAARGDFKSPVDAAHALAKENVSYKEIAEKMEAHHALAAKAMGESTISAGGAWVPDEFSNEFIDVLVPQAVILQQGITPLPSSRDTLTIPKMTSTTTAAYIGENAAPSLSAPGTGQLQMKNRKLAAAVVISQDLVRDAAVAADAIVRNRLVRDFALKMDLAAIRGVGSQYSPMGLRYLTNSANVTTESGTTLADIIFDLEELIGFVEDSNIPPGNWGYLFSHRVKRGIRQLRDGVGSFIYKDEMAGGMINGYKFAATNQIPNNLGGGSDSEIYFCAWPEMYMTENLGMEVKASTEAAYDNNGTAVSAFSNDQMVIQVIGRHDFALAHDLACAVISNSSIGS